MNPETSRRTPPPGGHVTRVEPGSLAEAAGLAVGDTVVSINGHVLRDVVDYRFYSADEELEIVFRRPPDRAATLRLERTYGQDLGLEFSAPTFDGIRHCRNRCDFCFVRQMPRGLRKTLYIRDDDYRYSFLFGNFVTLTNLQEEDWARLAEQRLSPLYVSVQATDPSLRARLLGVTEVPDILAQINRLGTLGIEVHAQVVIIPGLNDGPALAKTVHELALCPAVSSIGLVPVGITRYHSCGLRTVTAQEAGQIVAWARGLQRKFRRERGVGLVYPSDEFFLLADQPLPSARAYDGFPQVANGVGLTRLLLADWARARRHFTGGAGPGRPMTLVCGMLIAPVLRRLAQELATLLQSQVDVLPVPNAFLGETVTVSGLLLAQDVINTLRTRNPGDLVVLPRVMFDATGEHTLDDQTPADIERQVGRPVAVADRMSEVLRLGRGESMGPDHQHAEKPQRPSE